MFLVCDNVIVEIRWETRRQYGTTLYYFNIILLFYIIPIRKCLAFNLYIGATRHIYLRKRLGIERLSVLRELGAIIYIGFTLC